MNLSYSPSAATNYPTERGSQVIGWGAFSDDVRLIIRHTLSDWSLYIFSTDELQQHWANKVHQPHSRARARTHTHIHTYTHVCTYTHRLTPPTHTHTHTHIHTRGGWGVYITLHCHHQKISALKWAAVRVIVIFHWSRGPKSQSDSVHIPHYLKRKVSRSGIEPRSICLPALRLADRPFRLTG